MFQFPVYTPPDFTTTFMVDLWLNLRQETAVPSAASGEEPAP